MYCCLCVLIGLKDCVFFRFMVAGHTEKMVDWTFWHVKRLLRTRNIGTLCKMMYVIETSSTSSLCVLSCNVF